MDGRCGRDSERWKTPAWRGSIRCVSRHEYMRRAREFDRNYHVVEWRAHDVVLRLDFPGAGLLDAPELLRAMHAHSVLRGGLHPHLGP